MPIFLIACSTTPFAVHYEKIRNHLRETATNSAKIHSLARKYEHLRLNQIQLRFLHFNQHSITLLGIHMRHSAHKREKYTFINLSSCWCNESCAFQFLPGTGKDKYGSQQVGDLCVWQSASPRRFDHSPSPIRTNL